MINHTPREPRDTTPESDNGICFLCGGRVFNGDLRRDADGRDFHADCISPYLLDDFTAPTGAH